MSDLECPYCEADLDVNHDDGFGYEEDVAHQMECRHCEKNFVFQTSISFSYGASKADCLNGAPHNVWVHEDHICKTTRCKDCDHVEYEWKPTQ